MAGPFTMKERSSSAIVCSRAITPPMQAAPMAAVDTHLDSNGANGGNGGMAAGGAIYSTGPVIISYSILSNNFAEAGNGGNGGNAYGGVGNGGSAGMAATLMAGRSTARGAIMSFI